MLIFKRQPRQSLSIYPHPTLDPRTTVEVLFGRGPIQLQVVRVQGPQVCLGVVAPAGLCIVREELRPRAVVNTLSVESRERLARKFKVLKILNHHSTQSLAVAAGLAPSRVLAAETGAGEVVLDDLEKIARVLGVKVVELFFSPGRTAAERWVLGLLQEEGEK